MQRRTLSASEEMAEWAEYCARRAKETKGAMFEEPELTEIRRGWERVIARLHEEAIKGA